MEFEQDKSIVLWGQKAGYLFSYALFTAILYFVLNFTGKIPAEWSVFHIAILTLCIVFAGIVITRLLR
jgi:hypothetical protein